MTKAYKYLGLPLDLMPDQAQIIDVRDIPSTQPGRLGKMDVMVTYQVDPLHVYMVTLHKEEFSEAALQAAMKKDVDEKRKLIGKTFTL